MSLLTKRGGRFGLLSACVESSSSRLMASFPLDLLLSPSLALSVCISLSPSHLFTSISLGHHLPPVRVRFIVCKQILC